MSLAGILALGRRLDPLWFEEEASALAAA